MKSLSVLVKPVSGLCNLQCQYCFYNGHMSPDSVKMSDETMEELIAKSMMYCDGRCSFLFQGGEPTLAGLAFYRRFVTLVKQYNKHGVQVDYAIQTNGQTLNAEWADFFARNEFLAGVSIDGTKQAHDYYRRRGDGNSSYDRAAEGIYFLKQAGVDFAVTVTVTDLLSGKAHEIYQTFKRNGWNRIHIIPCIPNSGIKQGLTPAVYADFINTLFDCWMDDIYRGDYVSIRLFENYVQLLAGGGYELCGLLGKCSNSIVVENNGDCYPCDFYVEPTHHIGSIKDHTMAELLELSHRNFIKPAPSLKKECETCGYFRICGGGCRRYRNSNGEYYYCSSMKSFFSHCFSSLMKVAQYERRLRTQEQRMS